MLMMLSKIQNALSANENADSEIIISDRIIRSKSDSVNLSGMKRRVRYILTGSLSMRKVCMKTVLTVFTDEQKLKRQESCEAYLPM